MATSALSDYAHPQGPSATPTAATGYGQEQVKRKARAIGYDHHMVKPVGASNRVRCLPKLRKAPSGRFGLTLSLWQ